MNQTYDRTAPIAMVSRPLPSDAICDVFYAHAARIGKAFRERDCVPYWLSLERDADDWVVFVVVAEESVALAGELLDSMDGNLLSIRMFVGAFGPIKFSLAARLIEQCRQKRDPVLDVIGDGFELEDLRCISLG